MVRSLKDVFLSVENSISVDEKLIIRLSIQWNVMLMTISLLDELNKYFFVYHPNEKELQDRINGYKNIVKPMLAEINSWHDLRKFRNNVLAHNFRIYKDNFKSVLINNKLNTYNIPQYRVDLVILCKYLDAITKVAEEIFAKEYEESIVTIESFPKKEKNSDAIVEKGKKCDLIIAEVNSRIESYNSIL